MDLRPVHKLDTAEFTPPRTDVANTDASIAASTINIPIFLI
jgi:hypothetical protein